MRLGRSTPSLNLINIININNMFKIGDRVRIKLDAPRRLRGHERGVEGVIVESRIVESIPGMDRAWVIRAYNGNTYYNLEEDLELIEEDNLIEIRGIEYKNVANVGDRILIKIDHHFIEGVVGEKTNDNFYFWQNELDGGSGEKFPEGYRFSYCLGFNDDSYIIKIKEPKKVMPTKKREAKIEILKESGKIFISLKIPSEIEDFFKSVSGGKIKESNAWFEEAGEKVGVKFYSQEKGLEAKLTRIEPEVYSDFGTGLMKDDYINVAILRTVGASEGVKIYSEGFNSITNADLQDYVRRLGMYIKKLWESNISSTKIKSVISFEL